MLWEVLKFLFRLFLAVTWLAFAAFAGLTFDWSAFTEEFNLNQIGRVCKFVLWNRNYL